MFTESEIREALKEQQQCGWDDPQNSLEVALRDMYSRQQHDAAVVAAVVSYLTEYLPSSKGLFDFVDLDTAERAFQRTYADAEEVARDWAEDHWDGFNEVGGEFFDYAAFGQHLVRDSSDVFVTEPDSGQLACFWNPESIPNTR